MTLQRVDKIALSILTITDVTGTYTITPTDQLINCLSGTFVVTLPTAVGIKGRVYDVKNSGVGVITLEGDGSETIDGVLNKTLSSNDALHVVSDGGNWLII